MRQELIRPDSSVFAGDEAFRFRHILIRDAAYESLPKATRAELHEQFANWLDGQKLIERDEILGYHLEQAQRYRRELDPEAAELPGLAGRAAEHLAAAGRAALDRGDARAARTLLERATAVLPQNDERRLAHAPELADAYHETADKRAFEILTKALSAGNPISRARAAVRLGNVRPSRGRAGSRRRNVLALLEEARAVFEAESHDLGLAEYWQAEAQERWAAARAAETAEACDHALLHLERAGAAQSHIGQRTRQLLLRTYIFSPIRVDDALARVSELSRDDDGPLVRAAEHIVIGSLLSMKGEIDRALELVREARQMFADAGLLVSAWRGTFEADIAIRAGDWPKAERTLRDGFDRLEELGEHSYSSTLAAVLPMVLVSQRKLAAAREALDQARRITADDDLHQLRVHRAWPKGGCWPTRTDSRKPKPSVGTPSNSPTGSTSASAARSRTRTSRRLSRSRESPRKPPAKRPRRSGSWRRRATSCLPRACESGWLPLAFGHPNR